MLKNTGNTEIQEIAKHALEKLKTDHQKLEAASKEHQKESLNELIKILLETSQISIQEVQAFNEEIQKKKAVPV